MRRISKERMKCNGFCHWEGFRLMRKKRERKVRKRIDKYILQLLLKGSQKKT